MSTKLSIRAEVKYTSVKDMKKAIDIVEQLKKEGWKIEQSELHKDGIGLHIIYLKRTIK